MENNTKSLVTRVEQETPESPVTISFRRRSVDMYYIFDQELEVIGSASAQSSLHLGFFGASFGASVSLWATVITVDIINPYTYSAFWATALVSTVLAVYFGIRSTLDFIKTKKQVKLIRDASPNREPQPKTDLANINQN